MKVVRGTDRGLVSEVGAEVDEGKEDNILVGADRRIVVLWTLFVGATEMLFLAVVVACPVVRAAFVVAVVMRTAVTELLRSSSCGSSSRESISSGSSNLGSSNCGSSNHGSSSHGNNSHGCSRCN